MSKRNRPMAMVISRKYYKDRLWKITTKLCPTHNYPHCVNHGYAFVKCYQRRELIGGNWEFIRGIRYEL